MENVTRKPHSTEKKKTVRPFSEQARLEAIPKAGSHHFRPLSFEILLFQRAGFLSTCRWSSRSERTRRLRAASTPSDFPTRAHATMKSGAIIAQRTRATMNVSWCVKKYPASARTPTNNPNAPALHPQEFASRLMRRSHVAASMGPRLGNCRRTVRRREPLAYRSAKRETSSDVRTTTSDSRAIS